MKPIMVDSTTLSIVAYDSRHRFLQVEFHDRTTYRYSDVPLDVFRSLLNASSKGAFFNRHIRGRFPYARVEAPSLS